MAREINLVPDVKGEMIKALKLRNFILFLSIVVSIASAAVVAVLGTILTAQQSAVDGKMKTVESLSDKVKSYSDLTDFLTIKDQLSGLQTISNKKQLLSRTFNILSALMPTGADTIKISELNVNLSGDAPVLMFDAQANAGVEPLYDYRVVDAFIKSMEFMRFDYGRYVDAEGREIPSYCIIETGEDGATLMEKNSIYAWWTKEKEGCDPSVTSSDNDNESETKTDEESEEEENEEETNLEEYSEENMVKIYRTPQYNTWYDKKYMTQDGAISGIEHFESKCITYYATKDKKGNLKWNSENNKCLLVNKIFVPNDHSNGRGADNELVARFSAQITINPEAYKFKNKHVLAFGPEGRHNVTDSYNQIQAMFSERAKECTEDDTECQKEENENNENGEKQNG